MHSRTFGNQLAAEELAEDLNKLNDKVVKRQVCRYLAQFNENANVLSEKLPPKLRDKVLTLYCRDRLKTLHTEYSRIPESMKTFISNLIRTKTKSIIRGYY